MNLGLKVAKEHTILTAHVMLIAHNVTINCSAFGDTLDSQQIRTSVQFHLLKKNPMDVFLDISAQINQKSQRIENIWQKKQNNSMFLQESFG